MSETQRLVYSQDTIPLKSAINLLGKTSFSDDFTSFKKDEIMDGHDRLEGLLQEISTGLSIPFPMRRIEKKHTRIDVPKKFEERARKVFKEEGLWTTEGIDNFLMNQGKKVMLFYYHMIKQDIGIELSPVKIMGTSEGMDSGCGRLTGKMGPLYCSSSELIYVYGDQMLRMFEKLGLEGVEALAFIISHEVYHHVIKNFLFDGINPITAKDGSKSSPKFDKFMIYVEKELKKMGEITDSKINTVVTIDELKSEIKKVARIAYYSSESTPEVVSVKRSFEQWTDTGAGAYFGFAGKNEISKSLKKKITKAVSGIGDDAVLGADVAPEKIKHGTSQQRVAALIGGITGDDTQLPILIRLLLERRENWKFKFKKDFKGQADYKGDESKNPIFFYGSSGKIPGSEYLKKIIQKVVEDYFSETD